MQEAVAPQCAIQSYCLEIRDERTGKLTRIERYDAATNTITVENFPPPREATKDQCC